MHVRWPMVAGAHFNLAIRQPVQGGHNCSIIAWAVATPFAEEYDAPWLYGLAAVTNLARVGSRQRWLSDTVAGSALGYAIGRVFWESSRASQKGAPRVMAHPAGVNVAWEFNSQALNTTTPSAFISSGAFT